MPPGCHLLDFLIQYWKYWTCFWIIKRNRWKNIQKDPIKGKLREEKGEIYNDKVRLINALHNHKNIIIFWIVYE